MSFSPVQLRRLVRLELTIAGLPVDGAAENLLMLTYATECIVGGRIHLWQVGGPALGIFQMEPRTHWDLWANYLAYRPPLAARVAGYIPAWAREEALVRDLGYQIRTARAQYLRFPEALPSADDIEGLARYWKRWWNTDRGKGAPEKAVAAYTAYCEEAKSV